jgi:hypothetical protein
MTEYPSIINSSKAPRANCVAFVKYDGSNFRAKYTQKQGFNLFGSRRELIDESHPHLGEAVTIFKRDYKDALTEKFKKDKELRNEREIVVFGEFFGAQSYAGIHQPNDPKDVVIFDVLVGHKNHWFFPPMDFIKEFQDIVRIPPVLYVGNLNDKLIADVRSGVYTPEFHRLTDNRFKLFEGVVCCGTQTRGDFCGKVWKCKIKTQEYLDSLRARWGEEGVKKYGE